MKQAMGKHLTTRRERGINLVSKRSQPGRLSTHADKDLVEEENPKP
jgi:hypothetical protein